MSIFVRFGIDSTDLALIRVGAPRLNFAWIVAPDERNEYLRRVIVALLMGRHGSGYP
jgi:hypothetical protein